MPTPPSPDGDKPPTRFRTTRARCPPRVAPVEGQSPNHAATRSVGEQNAHRRQHTAALRHGVDVAGSDNVLRELDGLRALARALVGSDADADDLLQDTAVDAIRHPPHDDDRPTRPWLAAVLRN